jgi:large repetitive protein
MRLKLALIVVGVVAAIAATGASGADFDVDGGPCRETPGEKLLLRCPTGHVGVPYEVELESEEGSGCEPYDWFEVVNGALPVGLSMSRDGVISGVPTGAGLSRFWVWNHDLTAAQGGPSWCEREDRSEREFSIPIDPGLAIVNASVKPATVGEPYTETLAAKQVVSLDPLDGPDVEAMWSLESGALPPGTTLSTSGVLSGTPTSEGSYEFVVKAQNGSPADTETYTLTVRQPVSVVSPLGSTRRPSSEVGVRFGKTFTATGGSGAYTWALASGALPPGVALDTTRGTIAGSPEAAGSFAFALMATDSEGRAANASAALIVAPRLSIKTLRLKKAKLARPYRAKLATGGGVQPLKWKVVRGRFPRGVRFSPKVGTIAGIPRRTGSFRVTLEARDALGAKSRKTFVLRVVA